MHTASIHRAHIVVSSMSPVPLARWATPAAAQPCNPLSAIRRPYAYNWAPLLFRPFHRPGYAVQIPSPGSSPTYITYLLSE